MNLTISERNINEPQNATAQFKRLEKFSDVARCGLITNGSPSDDVDVDPTDSKTKTPNEVSENTAISRGKKTTNTKKFPKKLASSAPKKSFEKIVSTLSITADKITPVPLKLDQIPLEDSEERTREETAINFDALNEALSWDPDKSWNDSSSGTSGSTDDSESDSTDYGEDDRTTEIRGGSFEEVSIGGSGELLSRSTVHRPLHAFTQDHVEAQPTGLRRPRRRGGGFRSLMLLGLLLVVAVLALLTLSQVVLVEHRVLDHLGHDQLQPALPLRPGRALQRILTGATLGAGGGAKGVKRQFKIEPLLNREAPSVEANLARTILKKIWTSLSAAMLEESLSVYSFREQALVRAHRLNLRNSSRYGDDECRKHLLSHAEDIKKCKDVMAADERHTENEKLSGLTTRRYENINGKYSGRNAKEYLSTKITPSLSKLDGLSDASPISSTGNFKAEIVYTNSKREEVPGRTAGSVQLKSLSTNDSEERNGKFATKHDAHKRLNGYRLTTNDNLIYNKSLLLKQNKRTSAGGKILTVGIEKNSAKTRQALLDRRKNPSGRSLGSDKRRDGCQGNGPCHEKNKNEQLEENQNTLKNNANVRGKNVVAEPNYSDILSINVPDVRRSENAIGPGDEIEAADLSNLNYPVNEGDFLDLSPGNEPFGIYRDDDESIMEVLEQTSFVGDDDDDVPNNDVSVIDSDKSLEDSYEDVDAMYKDILGSGVDLPLDPLHQIELKFQPLDRLPKELGEQDSRPTVRNKKRVTHKPKLMKLHRHSKDSTNIFEINSRTETSGKTNLKPSTRAVKPGVMVQNDTKTITRNTGTPSRSKTSKSEDRQYEAKDKRNETSHSTVLPLCPEVPPDLKGRLPLSFPRADEVGALGGLLKNLSWVSPGGSWSPLHSPHHPCVPRHRVAVIVPYRDRLQHLAISLSWLHTILRAQQLEYTIYVAEQVANVTFNKGSVMNAGFLEAFTTTNAECFVFHDVDMLAEDDRNMYSCPSRPRHLSVGVDTLQYQLPYFLLVGGVLAVRGRHFLGANGYSNMYWGWGGEDDDMGYRLVQSKLGILRPVQAIARYSMIPHTKRPPLTWMVRGKLVRTSSRRYRVDGLNTLQYKLVSRARRPLYTHLLLDVGTPPTDIVNLTAP